MEEERERSMSEAAAGLVSSRSNSILRSNSIPTRGMDDAEYSELSETTNPIVESSTRYVPVQDEETTIKV